MKRVRCKSCDWDARYDEFVVQEHQVACKTRAGPTGAQADHSRSSRSSSVDELAADHFAAAAPARAPAPAPLVPVSQAPPTNRGPSYEELEFQLVFEFDELRAQRWERLQDIRKDLARDWRLFYNGYRTMHQAAQLKIAKLRDDGFPQEAQRLAGHLLKECDIGTYEIVTQTPINTECISIRGFDAWREAPEDTSTAAMAQRARRWSDDAVGGGAGTLAHRGGPGSNTAGAEPMLDGASAARARGSLTLSLPGASAQGLDETGGEEKIRGCSVCHNANHRDMLVPCSRCFNVFHSGCVGLEKAPQRPWRCAACGGEAVRHDLPEGALISSQELNANAVEDFVGHCGNLAGLCNQSVTLSQAKRGMHWICRTKSGIHFILQCACPKTVARSYEAFGRATHHTVPFSFHTEPFRNGNALRHFQKVHGDRDLDIRTMLWKYGSEGKCVQ